MRRSRKRRSRDEGLCEGDEVEVRYASDDLLLEGLRKRMGTYR